MNDCSSSFYYSETSTCPYKNYKKNKDVKDLDNSVWADYKNLKKTQAEIIRIIEELSSDKNDILKDANTGIAIDVTDVGIISDLDNLANKVDDLKMNENEKSQNFQSDLAEELQNQSIAEINKKSDADTDQILNEIEEDYGDVSNDISEFESLMSDALGTIKENMAIISDDIAQDYDTLETDSEIE